MLRSFFLISLACTLLPASLTAQRNSGLVFEDAAYEALPIAVWEKSERLPLRSSLKPYAPFVQNQGEYANCVGWATAYAARTIAEARKRGIQDRNLITQRAFSPGFTYRLSISNAACGSGASLLNALMSMQRVGAVTYKMASAPCPDYLNPSWVDMAKRYRIGGYQVLFYAHHPNHEKVSRVKSALASGQPVVIGMNCPPSFEHADGKPLWQPTEIPGKAEVFGHAVCIVGYDDQKSGGAFEIMNSWGEAWGDQGFIWVKYSDFIQYTKYALTINEVPASPASGNR